MLRIFILVVSVLAAVDIACAVTCGSCGEINSAIACVSENSMKSCVNGQPTGSIISCPQGKYCVDSAKICSAETGLYVDIPCSQYCGTCDRKTGVACVSRTKFALCMGELTPSFVIGECPEGSICSTSAGDEYCVSESKASSDCVISLVGRSFGLKSTETLNRCDVGNSPGLYIVNGSDCKNYTYCGNSGEEIVETNARCPGTTTFDVEQAKCIEGGVC